MLWGGRGAQRPALAGFWVNDTGLDPRAACVPGRSVERAGWEWEWEWEGGAGQPVAALPVVVHPRH